MDIISSLVGAGSSLLGNIFGKSNQDSANKNNLKINQMNNEFNERMLNKQLDYQTEMWNKTNEYNDPKNARARLEAAGYNPSSYFSNGAAGTASAMSGGGASAGSSGNQQAFRPDLSGVGNAIARGIELSEMKKNNEVNRANIQADVDLKRVQQKYQGAKLAAEIMDLTSSTRDRNTKTVAQEITNSYLRDMLSADLSNKRREGQLMELERESRVINNAYNDARLQNYGKQFAADMAEQFARIDILKQQKRLTDKQVDTELEKALEIAARRSGINLENKKKHATLQSEIEKAYKDAVDISPMNLVGAAVMGATHMYNRR